MDTMGDIDTDNLERRGQGWILEHIRTLNPSQQQQLASDLEQVDWGLLSQALTTLDAPVTGDSLAPAPCYPAPPAPAQHEHYANARRIGAQLIGDGKVCALTVAGGQGTRLGFDGPKGMFKISPVKQKSLFEVFADQVAATGAYFGTPLHWFVMTSPSNDAPTREFFIRNEYFGLDCDCIHFFTQGVMPIVDPSGRLMLEEVDRLAFSPDGHGGVLRALRETSSLDLMQRQGIEQISYFQIDNPLVRAVDPLFVGLHALENAQMSSKVVAKRDAMEQVGNLCLVNEKPCVVEYTELPDSLAKQTNADGTLRFNSGSIAVHIISVDYVDSLTAKGFLLPMHRALKKVPHIDRSGNRVEPSEPNGIKLEAFIFDALPLSNRSLTLQTLREEEFSPVKNADGQDSPQSCRSDMVRRATRWLRTAGVGVPEDTVVEIDPRHALDADELTKKIDSSLRIASGATVYLE